jgi:curved DNA-binding protein
MARKYHPDLNQTIRKLKFKELNEANEVLSSTENRKKYDEYGENWQNAEQYEQSKDNSNTTNEVDNKLISVAVERIIRTFESMFGGRSARGVVVALI